jgi:hypothetical protein
MVESPDMPQRHTSGQCILFCIIAVLLFSVPVIAQTAEQIVKIKTTVGSVEIRSANSSSWKAARVGMIVKTGWDVRTLIESSAELEYASGTLLRIGENSVLTLSSLAADPKNSTTRTSVKVSTGQVWGNIRKLTSTNSKFNFETPTAVASIRGTRLGLKVGRGKTAVDVYEGEVEVHNRSSGRSVRITRENRAVVAEGSGRIDVANFNTIRWRLPGERKSLEDPFADTTAAPRDTTTQGLRGDTASSLTLAVTTPADQSIVTQTPLLIRGTTPKNALVTLAGKEIPVAADGSFSDFQELQPGTNTIQIAAMRGEEVKNLGITVIYQPPLFLNVTNIIDNMDVIAQELQLEIELTEGAEYSVNGAKGASKVTLTPGRNQIVVAAWDRWGNRTEKPFLVNYRQVTGFALEVVSPKDNATVTFPMISVVGSTSPGAGVTVNGIQASANASGFFSVQAPIPDEARDYTITVTARFEGQEKSVERTVTYAPPLKPLELTISSPVPGQVIRQSSIHISGKTGAGTFVKVNGRPAVVSGGGIITTDIQVSEKDIGTLGLEIIASRDDKEISKSIAVKVDIASPQVNTSKPRIQVTGLGRQATKTAQLPLQVFDQTPDDQIAVSVINNGVADNFTVENGGRETIVLNEGKNTLVIKAKDLAGNTASPVQSTIYYLPGPIEISVIEPSENPITIDDLPPWPQGAASAMKIRFRLEIKDNIGTVPESIKYCRITSSAGQTVVLNNERNYYYYGDMPVVRGVTVFTIQVEDWAGTIQQKRVEARIDR